MHVPREDRVSAWFDASESDLRSAELLTAELAHVACFHAQQAAEKALKALVTQLSGDAPQVHAIVRLFVACEALGTAIPSDVRERGAALDKFYVATRYPDALDFADASSAYRKHDAERAVEDARVVLAWARLAASS